MAGRRPKRYGLPYGILQTVEYLMAFGLCFFAIHAQDSSRWYIVGAGVAIGALAATAKGPLGMLPLVGPRTHRGALLVLAVALVAVTIVTGNLTTAGVAGPLLILALVLLRILWMGPPPPKQRAVPGERAETIGRLAGRATVQVSKQAEGALHKGARDLGRMAARRQARRAEATRPDDK